MVQGDDIAEARRQHEWAKAKREEAELEELQGSLIRADEAKLAWAGMISATRSAMLLMPAKLAPRVAVISDVRQCQALIDKEVRAVLSGLAEYRPAATTTMTNEPIRKTHLRGSPPVRALSPG